MFSYCLYVGIKFEAFDELGYIEQSSYSSYSGRNRKGKRRGKEKKATYLFRTPVAVSDVLALFQELKNLSNSSLFFTQLLHLQSLSTTSCLLAKALESLLNKLNILDPQLFADDGQITDRVNITLDVNDFSIVEASDDLENGIDSSDVRQESVTKTSSSRGTAGQTGNIVDGQVGRNARLGLVVFA